MPKIITTKRAEGAAERAKEYVKTHIIFPSGILGLIFMISGMASLGYQFLGLTYSWHTFVESTVLFAFGAFLGWGQTRYHRFILLTYPEFYAGRMKTASRSRKTRGKREPVSAGPLHKGQEYVPWFYLLGTLVLFGTAMANFTYGHVYSWAGLLLPWAGFFWAKLFFWRRVLGRARATSR